SDADTLDGGSNTDICHGETVFNCEDTSTAVSECPAETKEEEEIVISEERDTQIHIEKFYALDLGDPLATAPVILHQSYLRAPRRIHLKGEHLFAITNSDRTPYLRVLTTDTFDHIADCVLQNRVRAQDLVIADSSAFITFEKNLGAEFSEYPLRMDALEDCEYLNRNAKNNKELPDGARAIAVLDPLDLAFITVGQNTAAVQTVDLAQKDSPPRLLTKFRGVCDALSTIGSYLFGACRGDRTTITVFNGKSSEEEHLLFGTYTSPPFDAGNVDTQWQEITWDTAGTGSIVLRSRSADTLEHLHGARWVGPDGTRASSYAQAEGETLMLHAESTGSEWIQWKAYLQGDGTSTPELQRTILTFE
ncbi:MAG: hypothetical protein AAB853_02525, partial [Patescibacteria group bacterium]